MSYNKKDWHDLPDMSTPISATDLNRMEEGIADANGVIGVDAYDSTATYAINDLCIYNNTLYICTTAIITAEAFTAAHWKAISLKNNILIDGTWTPVLTTLEGVDPTMTYTTQVGNYRKIGDLVWISFYIRGKITALNGTNNFGVISGLPFQGINGNLGDTPINIGLLYALTENENNVKFNMHNNMIRIQYNYGSVAARLKVTQTNYFEIAGSGWYRTSE